LSQSIDVVMVPEHEVPQERKPNNPEEGVDVPMDQIDPDTLRNLIAEFVTREWEELGDSRHTLDDKIEQVRRQLKDKRAKVVFDLSSNTCNIVPCEGKCRL